MATATAPSTLNKGSITLQGSAAMIREFFHYGINNILFQRGVYPSDSFIREKRFGMTLLVSSDTRLQQFLDPFLSALEIYLSQKVLRRMIVAIFDVKTQEILERWVFEIEQDQVNNENGQSLLDEKKVRTGMCDVIRQITACVSFLPLLDRDCSFDVLIGLKHGTEVDEVGLESIQDLTIKDAERVQLRSFGTGHHEVKTCVEYKMDD